MADGNGRVRQERAGDVLVLVLAHAPSNALTPDMRLALIDALHSPGEARAIVIRAEGPVFSAASALDSAEGTPSVAALCAAVDACPVPVVVALTGAAVGPGADLALAAHARVASEDSRLALPDIALGLVSGAGSTQRLPRLLGAQEALRLLLTGRTLNATEALVIGLVDHVVEGDPFHAALAMAGRMPGPRPACDRREGLRDALAYQRAIAQARAEATRAGQPAPLAIVDCVEAAGLLPFDQGLVLETTLRADLETSVEAAGLRAIALAERRAAALPAPIAAARPRLVAEIAVAGQGSAVTALTVIALTRGFRVTWIEPDRARLTAALQAVATRQEAEVAAGRLSPTARDADWARLTPAQDAAALARCGLVMIGGPGSDRMVEAARQAAPTVPALVIGGAAGAMGLGLLAGGRGSELALPDGLPPVTAATAIQVLRRIGLPPVLVGRLPVVGARVAGAGRSALARLTQMGVDPLAVRRALGRFGAPLPDLEPGAAPRAMPEAEILNRWLAAMANEGLRLMAAGLVRRPSDVDVLMVQGQGFPRWRGGPMHQADRRGLLILRADLRRWQEDDPMWQPAPLIDRLLAEGRTLEALNG